MHRAVGGVPTARAVRGVTEDWAQVLPAREQAVRFAELSVGARWAGKSLAELELTEKTGLPGLAIKSGSADFAYNPDRDTKLAEGDVLVTMGAIERVHQARELLGSG